MADEMQSPSIARSAASGNLRSVVNNAVSVAAFLLAWQVAAMLVDSPFFPAAAPDRRTPSSTWRATATRGQLALDALLGEPVPRPGRLRGERGGSAFRSG